MKWETVSSTIGNSVYALWNNGRKLVTLVFNPDSNAARVEYGDEKRVYLLRKEGFLKNKLVFCNEYGIRLAHAGTENNSKFIVLNNQRYFYDLNDDQQPSLTIYQQSKDQPLAVCALNIADIQTKGRGKKSRMTETAYLTLLLALCYYLFNPR